MSKIRTSYGVAYYRLDSTMFEFFQKCKDKHGIIGFSWDPEDPWNFGVILGKENDRRSGK